MQPEKGEGMKHLAVAIAAIGMMWALAWCTVQQMDKEYSVTEKHIDAGHCRETWGGWRKC